MSRTKEIDNQYGRSRDKREKMWIYEFMSALNIGQTTGNPHLVTFWWIVWYSLQRGRFYRLGQLWLLLFSLVLEELELWPRVNAYLHLSTNRIQNINNVKCMMLKIETLLLVIDTITSLFTMLKKIAISNLLHVYINHNV